MISLDDSRVALVSLDVGEIDPPTRGPEEIAAAVEYAMRLRQQSEYLTLAPLLPGLLRDAAHYPGTDALVRIAYEASVCLRNLGYRDLSWPAAKIAVAAAQELRKRPGPVGGMHRHRCPASPDRVEPDRVEPDRGRDVELARQCGIAVAERAGDRQRPLPSPLAHTVGERADVGAVDGTHQVEHNSFGVSRNGEAEVQVEGKPALVAGIWSTSATPTYRWSPRRRPCGLSKIHCCGPHSQAPVPGC
ncbi:MAG: hypothetical protein QOE51_281 [Actinoplanes sp.]|nr:hypothetical protein [Actinoplanes sp.]